ncbi:MAG TPA: glucokinase [Burkholderiales bacterium]|nr:glucokinase [Burkholderiales bacterium]
MGKTLRLVGDIGGTNARFALVADGSSQPHQEQVVPCAEFEGLEQAIRRYLADHGNPGIREAALDVATGLTGDFVQLTNGPWGFSIEKTRRALALDRLHVINDFTALALSVPTLQPHELRQVGGGNSAAGTAIAVIGPGTGLGVSGLLPAGEGWITLQGEGGHTAFSPTTEREIEVLRWLMQRFEHVSTERVVSGMGLQNLYQALCALDHTTAEQLNPAQITEGALGGKDKQCREALDMFCAILGAAAANLVVTLGARAGCYVGGGIIPRLGEYFSRSPFRARFECKGRFSTYIAAVPTYVILAETPALRGLATIFQHTEKS